MLRFSGPVLAATLVLVLGSSMVLIGAASSVRANSGCAQTGAGDVDEALREILGSMHVDVVADGDTLVMSVECEIDGAPGSGSGEPVDPRTGIPLTFDLVCDGDYPELCVPVHFELEDPVGGVSVSDFVTFSPAPAVAIAQPDGVAVRRVPANFVASASTHVRSGELLGQAASAEFTPVGFVWDFGDGEQLITGAAGATWEALGQDEFTPTATSHAYAERGTYTVTLTTYYGVRAAYAEDGVWWDVPGALAVTSDPFAMRVVTITPVLVARDCIQDPTGIGC